VPIRPELQALREDDTPQRLAQSRLAEVTQRWSEHSGASIAEAELARFAAGAALEDLPFLAALFTPGDPSAAEFTAGLVAVQAAALEAEPLGQVIWQHSTDDFMSKLVVAHSGNATLSLHAFFASSLAAMPTPEVVNFSPGESWEHVLAGSAQAELVRIAHTLPNRAELVRAPLQLVPGVVVQRHCGSEAQLFGRISASLVTLKLHRQIEPGAVGRQYRLDGGQLVHQAAGNQRDSRLEFASALLGRMGRKDAAPLFAAMSEEEASVSLRWQVLRECLALDSGIGFAALCRLAAKPDDPLAAPAGALRAQLLEAYPQLAACQNGVSPCPA
jgi:hypothetical protein